MSILTRPSIRLSALCLVVLLGQPLWAGSHGYGSSQPSATSLRNGTTNGLIRDLQRTFKKCFQLEPVYRYDCYDDAYDRGAAKLAGKPGYEEAQAALAQVGRDIAAIVADNRDPTQPALRKNGRIYQPIKKDNLPTAKAGVIRSIEEAQTVLLRARDKGDHFSRIASALESNKVLLRSAMNWLASRIGTA